MQTEMTRSTHNLNGATEEQMQKYEQCRTHLGERLLTAHISKFHILVIKYSTKAGYFVRATYSVKGEWIESKYYKSIDTHTGHLKDFMFKKP